ncbi:MAG: hypothetical protein ACI80N_003353, partial [Gammaproteobacteria bacterium]
GAAQAADADAEVGVEMLRLRSGAIEWGHIRQHDPDGMDFVRLTNGGQVRVLWSLLDPKQEAELRQRFGYVDVSSDELMIDVERVQLREGGEVLGLILSRDGDHFLVKVGGNLQSIPKDRVLSVSVGVSVPILDVYSRPEVYAYLLGSLESGDAESQREMAQSCERILDFEHASLHYQAALDLQEEPREDLVFALQRATRKAAQQEQIDYIREADQLRKKGRFDEALTWINAFAETFPRSPLQEDALRKRVAIEQSLERAVGELVRSRWHYWLSRKTRAASREMSLEQARTFAESRLSQEIRQAVLEDVHKRISATVDDVDPYWTARRKVRYHVASYGSGTWLLGEDGAMAGTGDEVQAEEDAPVGALDTERAALETKIKRFLENQDRARRARSSADEADSQETFWSNFSSDSRAQWIISSYAEHGGDLEVRPRPHLRACSGCGGTGAREVVSTGGVTSNSGIQLFKCSVCYGIGIIRRVHYR